MILSLLNISTETQQAQSRLGALCPDLGSEISGQWHPVYLMGPRACPGSTPFGGARRMFALPLFATAPSLALDTRVNAKQEGTP